MSERPILFSGPMVRAILAGKKSVTRRVVKPQPNGGPNARMVDLGGATFGLSDGDLSGEWPCPYGAPGDVLWVRETWAPLSAYRGKDPGSHALAARCFYRADYADGEFLLDEIDRWRPSIHMPRWASRLSLLVKDVRVERLQEITKADVDAEGVLGDEWYDFRDHAEGCAPPGSHIQTECEYFATRWDRLYAKRAPWESNPWVWVVTFERVTEKKKQ